MAILKIKCKGSGTAKLDELMDFQGDLKVLTDTNYKKFKADLIELGFSEPISVWENEGKLNILNGHQRIKTLKNMRSEGWTIPPLPISHIEADDYKQAKKKVLSLTSQFGTLTADGLQDFCEKAELDMKDMIEELSFPELDHLVKGPKEPNVQPEVEFSEVLDESNNYVVLVFRNDVDWLNAETHFDLKTVASKRKNGKPWSRGVGRVLDGAEYLKGLNKDG